MIGALPDPVLPFIKNATEALTDANNRRVGSLFFIRHNGFSCLQVSRAVWTRNVAAYNQAFANYVPCVGSTDGQITGNFYKTCLHSLFRERRSHSESLHGL